MQSTITLIYLVISKKGDDGVKLTLLHSSWSRGNSHIYMVWIRYNYRMIIFFFNFTYKRLLF